MMAWMVGLETPASERILQRVRLIFSSFSLFGIGSLIPSKELIVESQKAKSILEGYHGDYGLCNLRSRSLEV